MSEIISATGHPIAYYPLLVPLCGSVTATLLFCQLVYWREKGRDRDGWIYKTAEELERETGLTLYQQRSARKLLKASGIVEEKRKLIPPKVHFRICIKQLNEKWEEHLSKVGKIQNKKGEDFIKRRKVSAQYTSESTQRIKTESTSERSEQTREMNFRARPSSGKDFEHISLTLNKET